MAKDRVLLDVNALAIYLVEDHPGHKFIADEIEPGMAGRREILVFDYLPLRAHWVLTSKWKIPEEGARDAIISFLDRPFKMVSATRETVKEAYEVAEEKEHDVFDSFYLALARQENVTKLLTTDTHFHTLCEDEEFDYLNPVPEDVLASFREIEG